MPSVSVVVSSYGDPQVWQPLYQRAARSVKMQTVQPKEFIGLHRMTGPIDEVRNLAISKATSDLVICLDADDELEPGYVEAMLVGTGDLRYPMMRYVQDGDCVIPAPIELPKRPLAQGNYMCIGTLFPRDLFIKVGGYSSWESWEDYHLFCKLVLYGARTNLCRNAIYRAHSTKQGRCNAVKNPQALMKSILDSLKPLELSSGISLSEVH